MFDLETWELASYVVTVIGLPVAIAVFLIEQRKERANEEDEVHQMLADAYNDFLKVVIDNADLRLRIKESSSDLTPEQRDRMLAIFDMLISLFERAYITAWQPQMDATQQRRWAVWEDYMREWLGRDDFYFRLAELLTGEDPDFAAHIRRLAAEERGPDAKAGPLR